MLFKHRLLSVIDIGRCGEQKCAQPIMFTLNDGHSEEFGLRSLYATGECQNIGFSLGTKDKAGY